MQVPSPLQAGENFKQATVQKVNQIIDYLKTQRLVSPNQSIKIDQLVSGISITVQASGGGSPSLRQDKVFKHPFRLYIDYDNNNNPQVCVQAGGINLIGNEPPQDYIEVGYEYPEVEGADPITDYYIPIENWKQDVEDGYYAVWLSIYEYYDSENDVFGTAGACFLTPAVNYVVPQVPGFINIPLGVIAKWNASSSSSSSESEQEKPEYGLLVDDQFIYGDITVDYTLLNASFALKFYISWDQTKIFKWSEDDVAVDCARVNPGRVYDNIGYINIKDDEENNDYPSKVIPQKTNDGKNYYCFLFNDKLKWVDNVNALPLSSDCMVICKFYISKTTLAYEQYYYNNINVSDKYPFKAYVGTDDNTGKQRIKFYDGQVFFISNQFYLLNFQNSGFNFDFSTLPDGEYGVIGVVKQMLGDASTSVIVVSDNVTTHDVPNIPGYRTFTICSFKKTTDENDSNIWRLEITFQYQTGNLLMYDYHCDEAFYPCFNVSAGSDSALKTSASDFLIDTVRLKEGVVFDANTDRSGNVVNFSSAITDSGFTIASNNSATAYLECIKSGTNWSKHITWSTSSPNLIEYTSGTANINKMNIPIADFRKINNQVIVQKKDGINIPTIDHKVKVVGVNDSRFREDAKPDYLIDKVLTDHLLMSAGEWPDDANGNPLKGYLCRAVEQEGGEEDLILRWDYPNITGYDSAAYKTMNLNEGKVIFEDQGKIRLNENESAARFLPDVVSAVEPLYISSSNQQLVFSANMSNYVSAINTSGDCISATVQSQTSMGKTINIELNKPCIFDDFNISGTDPINVTGSGNNWNVAFNDSDFVKNVTGGTCINASKNGSTVNVGVDVNCVLQNLSITGGTDISVTKNGNNYTVNYTGSGSSSGGGGKDVIAGTCLSASTTSSSVTLNVDKDCVFQGMNIQGGNKINVTGSGQSWTVNYIDDSSSSSSSGLPFDVAGCIQADTAPGASKPTLRVDIGCIFEDFAISGTNGVVANMVTVSGTQNSQQWEVGLNVSGAGILVYNNGTLTALAIPSAPSVLVAGSGGLTWIPYNTCESACQ